MAQLLEHSLSSEPELMESPVERSRAMSVPVLDKSAFSSLEGEFLLRRPSAVRESRFEEALLSLGAAMSATEFRDAVCAGLHATLTNVVKANAILIDRTSELLSYCTGDGDVKPLPRTGHLWKVVRYRTSEVIEDYIASSDPLCEVLGITEKKGGDGVAMLWPVVTNKDNTVIAVAMVVCDQPTAAQLTDLDWLIRNTLVAAVRVQKHTSSERHQMRTQGMLEVCGNLIDLDTTMLSLKIVKHMKSELFCKQCLLFIVDSVTGELCCQVFDDSPLDKEIRLNVTDCIYGRCVLSGDTLLVDNVAEDIRINPLTDFINGYEPQSMMCFPIYDQSSGSGDSDAKTVIGVAAAFDKIGSKSFGMKDVEMMHFILRFSSSMLSNTLAFQREMSLKDQNQALLQVAKTLFTSLDDSQVLLHAVMEEARNLIKAERCSLFLVDKETKELVAVVFDSSIPGRSPGMQETFRIPIGQGIAGYVAESGETVNIKDAYKHPKFYQQVDKTTGFKTRNILCIPICDNRGIVGVAELMNKIGGRYFTSYDEELAKAFSVYCGISIYHSILYNDIVKEQSRSRLATELMIYHMQISPDEVKQIACEAIPPPESFDPSIREYSYSPRVLQEHDTLRLIISMMQGMNLINKWRIPRDTLARFVLMVKKGYRNTPYHNWWHALSVTHFFFVLDQKCRLLQMLSGVEQFALFISCLCHDIDHRGTNNAFQVSSKSILASVYSSEGSVMERHHVAQTLCILHTDRCNIFQNLHPGAYKEVLAKVQSCILATDLANHLKAMKQMEAMSQTGYDPDNKTHHELLSSLIMTSCDLSNSCKDWEMTRKISELIYQEFFSQGDLEKALGATPSTMMDRDKAFIPEQQIGFLEGITLPVYRILSKILGDTEPVYQSVLENKARWLELKESAQ